MAFSLLWSLGLIISIIVFAIDFGLILNLKDLSKKGLAKYSIILFISTLILIYFINLFRVQFNAAIGIYNYLLLFLIAFALILSAYLINKDEDVGKKFRKLFVLSYISFIIMAFMCVVSKQALFGLNSLQISLLTSVSFVLITLIVYFVSKKLKFKLSFRGFESLYYIFGIYCLVISLFLPNIISLDMSKMSQINIVSIESMILTIVFLVIVAVVGLFYYRKNSMFR